MRFHGSSMQRKFSFTQFVLSALALIGLLTLAACGPPTIAPTTTPASSTVPASTPTPLVTSVPGTSAPLASASETPSFAVSRTPNSSGLPSFSHIYTIVMENKEYGSIVGKTTAPYLNTLIAQYGLATNYTGVAHPSEPNYLALFSGSTQGATDDGVYNLNGKNLADQIEAAGKTWRVFAENVPTDCFTGVIGVNGEDGLGLYARKHNPAISFTDISHSAARCANITDFKHFAPAAANYSLIVPNMCHDMHDCSVSAGDSFLQGFVPQILNRPGWQDDDVLFVTWDEGSTNLKGGGRIPLLVISNRVRRGFQSAIASNHYSLLRTVEDAWGLGCLNHSCEASNLSEFFR